MARSPQVTLDASVVLAWVLKEDEHEKAARLLSVSAVPASAVVETLYRAKEKGHRMASSQLFQHIVAIGAIIEPLREEDTVRAAELITQSRSSTHLQAGSLSLGDGLCIATAERLGHPLVTDDTFWLSPAAKNFGLRVRVVKFR